MFYPLVKSLIKMVGKYHTINATEVDFINAWQIKEYPKVVVRKMISKIYTYICNQFFSKFNSFATS